MDDLIIKTGSTRAIIKLDRVSNASEILRSLTRKRFSDYEFDRRQRRSVLNRKYFIYDHDTNELILPINGLSIVKEDLENEGINYSLVPETLVTPRNIRIKMIDGFVPRDSQIPVMDYFTKEFPYRKGLSTATGSGKTVSSISSIVKAGVVGMIICSGLTDQWERSIYNFTNAREIEDVYVIKGFKSLFDLLDSDLKPSFIIWSLETLRLYVKRADNYKELPPYEKFIEYFGVGIKVMDEVHLNFHADTLIDLRSNIPNNWYLTATFLSSNPSTRRVFDMIYPPQLQYNPASVDRYIHGVIVKYHGWVRERGVVRMRGYNHGLYEAYLLKRKTLLNNYFLYVIRPCIESYYIKVAQPGERMFLYFARLDMIDYMVDELKHVYPDKKICKYINGVPDTVLSEYDIIVTTPKKASCGTDCPMLRTVINTVSMRAPALVEQLRGRLRKLKSGNTPIYVEIVDLNSPSQMRHYMVRKVAHMRACKTFEEQLF